jgi:hypothetical protein
MLAQFDNKLREDIVKGPVDLELWWLRKTTEAAA